VVKNPLPKNKMKYNPEKHNCRSIGCVVVVMRQRVHISLASPPTNNTIWLGQILDTPMRLN